MLLEIGNAVLTYTNWKEVAEKANIGWNSDFLERAAKLVFAASISIIAQKEVGLRTS
jgi:hypothetical protein